MNLPIYRAKKIDSDEWIIGWLVRNKILVDIDENLACPFEIDPTTLAIHFSDMLDSQGNKIFASLNNMGGSILTDGEYEFILYFNGRKYRIIGNEVDSEINDYEEWNEFKIIGIQE